jgi:hypothetical protein
MSENLEDYPYILPDTEDEIIEDIGYFLMIMKDKKRRNQSIYAVNYLLKKCVDGLDEILRDGRN